VDPIGALIGAAQRDMLRLNQDVWVAKTELRRFALIHRRRVWSEGQRQMDGGGNVKAWQASEVNRLAAGSTDTTFIDVDGQHRRPPGIRY